MIGRVVLAALLAGIVAGLIMGAIQQLRITPLILAAEVYEKAQGAEHETMAEWQPEEGLPRAFFTTVTLMMTGAGFAAVLAGISLVSGIPITRANSVLWGLCGFLAVKLAPAAGLPPELPGMPAGDLLARQLWWVGTIAATGAAFYLIATRAQLWAIVLAVALIALPHFIGAPQPPSVETKVPAGLAAEFAAVTIAAAAVFWSLIGVFLGIALEKVSKGLEAA
jgi:cobalt transporter subunit CbtA